MSTSGPAEKGDIDIDINMSNGVITFTPKTTRELSSTRRSLIAADPDKSMQVDPSNNNSNSTCVDELSGDAAGNSSITRDFDVAAEVGVLVNDVEPSLQEVETTVSPSLDESIVAEVGKGENVDASVKRSVRTEIDEVNDNESSLKVSVKEGFADSKVPAEGSNIENVPNPAQPILNNSNSTCVDELSGDAAGNSSITRDFDVAVEVGVLVSDVEPSLQEVETTSLDEPVVAEVGEGENVEASVKRSIRTEIDEVNENSENVLNPFDINIPIDIILLQSIDQENANSEHTSSEPPNTSDRGESSSQIINKRSQQSRVYTTRLQKIPKAVDQVLLHSYRTRYRRISLSKR